MRAVLDDEDFRKTIASTRLVLAGFDTAWCTPCKMMVPVIDEVELAVGTAASFVQVDIEKSALVVEAYGVKSIPMFVLFKDGHELWRRYGIIPPSILRALVLSNL